MNLNMKPVMTSTMHLFLRLVMICILALMAAPITRYAPNVITPLLAIFYFAIMLYFFIFTMWTAGGKDVIVVNRGEKKPFMSKGFICGSIIAVFLAVVYLLPMVLPMKQGSWIYLVLYFVKLFFTMFASYAMMTVVGFMGGNLSVLDVATSTSYAQTVASTVVFFAIIICCVIAAGVGYIVGFKRIKLIQPWLDKWKRN